MGCVVVICTGVRDISSRRGTGEFVLEHRAFVRLEPEQPPFSVLVLGLALGLARFSSRQ